MSGLNRKLKQALALNPTHTIIVGVALSISIALMSGQRILNTSLESTLLEKSAELLTADMEVASTQALSTANIAIIQDQLPTHAKSHRQLFSSMIQFYGQQSTLVEIMAIEKNYPLRGTCLARNKSGILEPISDLIHTTQNALVIAESLHENTDITFGSTITIGAFKGTVVGIIAHEPDISIQSLQMGPRIYMALSNVQKTGFDPQLSRKYHSYFIRFKTPDIANEWVEPLNNALGIEGDQKTIRGSYGPSQPIVVRHFQDINNDIIRGFSSMRQFFLMLSLFILLLTGTAFGFIIWTSIIQQLNTIGNLQYLGLSSQKIHQFYKKESLKVTAIGTIIGGLIGMAIAQMVHAIICREMNIPSSLITIHASDILFIAGFSMIGIYAMTTCVLQLTKTSGIFKYEQPKKTSSLIIGLMGVAILALTGIFLFLNDVKPNHIVRLIGLFFGVFLLLGLIDSIVFGGLQRLPLKRFKLRTRLAIKYLSQGHTIRRMTFISICFSLIAMMSMALYEASLNNELNPKKSDQALPNLFVMDLYNYQLSDFRSLVTVPHDLSPLVRTRIHKINDLHLATYKEIRGISDDYFLQREQNLSSRASLYPTEKLTQGQWFVAENEIIEISVEKRFAKRLKLQLNDRIEFSIFGLPFVGTVSSFRSVDWSTLQPNFFMLFEPPYLDPLPQTWVGAIYTDTPTQTRQMQHAITQQFPNTTIIDIQNTSQKILGIFKSFMFAIKSGAIFCLLIGGLLFILLGKLYTDIRQHTLAMLHWIGVSMEDIQKMSLIENLCFSTITFATAFGISVGLCQVLFSTFIPIVFVIHWGASALIGCGVTVAVIGHWVLKKRQAT